MPHQAHTPPRAFSASFVAGPVLDIADAAPQPTRRLSLRLLRPPPSLPLSSSPSPSPSLLAASLLRRATPTTTTTITASHEEWVRRNWPPGRGTPRWHNRQRLRGERLQIRRCRHCCRRLRHRRGALRLSRRSRGREAHVAAHQPRLPLESELRRRPRRGHRAVELQVDREQPKPRDQVTPRCASAAARRVAGRDRRGALRLSRRSRGREAHVAAHPPRLPLESELRRRPRRGHRAVELQVDREQPKPRDQVTPRCASAAARRVADPPRSSSLTPPRPA